MVHGFSRDTCSVKDFVASGLCGNKPTGYVANVAESVTGPQESPKECRNVWDVWKPTGSITLW